MQAGPHQEGRLGKPHTAWHVIREDLLQVPKGKKQLWSYLCLIFFLWSMWWWICSSSRLSTSSIAGSLSSHTPWHAIHWLEPLHIESIESSQLTWSLIIHLLSSLIEEALNTWLYQKLPLKHNVGSCFLYPLPLKHLEFQPLGEHLVRHDLSSCFEEWLVSGWESFTQIFRSF